jgi:hypothetical protein
LRASTQNGVGGLPHVPAVLAGDCARTPPAWRNCTAASEPATRLTRSPWRPSTLVWT